MAKRKKTGKKKTGFNPISSDLRKVLYFIVKMLKPEEIKRIESHVALLNEKRCLSNPSCWRYCVGREWLTYRIKEILNFKAKKPVNDYRTGLLTLRNLRDLAYLVGINKSELGDVKRAIWWSQIVARVKQDEDSRMNRLKKLWAWLEERIEDTDVDYLMIHAPGHWQSKEPYNDPDWRARHLTNVFEITFMIQEVVNAKIKAKEQTPVVSGMSKIQLWIVTHEIMGLEEVPHSATKEIMWQNILQKIESDKIKPVQ